MDEVKLPPSPAPSFFAYRFQSHYGPVWRSSSETWNGLKPDATTGLHTTEALEDYAHAAVEADRERRASLPAGYQVHRLTLGEHQVLREAVADSAEVVAYGRLGEPEQSARKPLTDETITAGCLETGIGDARSTSCFELGVRFAERMHGIGEN